MKCLTSRESDATVVIGFSRFIIYIAGKPNYDYRQLQVREYCANIISEKIMDIVLGYHYGCDYD